MRCFTAHKATMNHDCASIRGGVVPMTVKKYRILVLDALPSPIRHAPNQLLRPSAPSPPPARSSAMGYGCLRVSRCCAGSQHAAASGGPTPATSADAALGLRGGARTVS